MLIKEKVAQAAAILEERDCDCWITFVRESSIMHDPMLDFLSSADMTWHSAFIVTRNKGNHAIVGELEKKTIEDLGVYDQVLGYVEGIGPQLREVLTAIDPRTIALNYSETSEVCDGLTHGMYLTLMRYLEEMGMADRVMSAEKITSSLRARKTPEEIARIRKAIRHTVEIFDQVAGFIAPGRSEIEIAAFMTAEVERRGLGLAWEPSHCPAVFTGPDTAGAHYRPTERKVKRGHLLNMDFGVKCEDYVSDLQRTFYVLREGETDAPPEVHRGFGTIVESIEMARATLKPGVQGKTADDTARGHIVAQGYEEYPHALGHQVGRFAHDGTALLGPEWEKYAGKPFELLEEQMVFTIEPRLTVREHGVASIEEMVVLTAEGAEYLSPPQKELILIR
ncbi:MAG: Xaa-Pro peptidase family protein [Acidobacteriota bacterium]|jgi:Xaa-Pro aminopeptidase